MIRLVRWLCDPARREAIEGDLVELYGDRLSLRYALDIVSVCARAPRTVVRSVAAALIVLVALGPVTRPLRYTVRAADPGGAFVLEIAGGRAVAATLDGVPVPECDLVQSGDSLIIRGGDHGADFRIALKPQGGIEWYPRRSVSH
ncbi:MAG TPA: hypothetical protein VIV83_08000 [Gemmatimonadales bacterium]|jgi:hypothetical protein